MSAEKGASAGRSVANVSSLSGAAPGGRASRERPRGARKQPDRRSAQGEDIRYASTGLLPGRTPDGRVRAVVDAVRPSVDGGRFAAKCIAGEPFVVEADCFADGHDVLRVELAWSSESGGAGSELEMTSEPNDLWRGAFTPPAPGRYVYRVTAWVDAFRSWRHDLERRVEAEDIRIALLVGSELLNEAASRARASAAADAERLLEWASMLKAAAIPGADGEAMKALALDASLAALADRHPDRRFAASSSEYPLVADRAKARFSAWYELFPRSASAEPGRHGTFRDVEARLDYVAELGFDVLYLPPIHPIGRDRRKGRNNALAAGDDDVGSPWAIGAAEGGHDAIHPQLGTIEDFRRLVAAANARGIDVALDVAFQTAPDHPWVAEHPDWFRRRPDGSVQYAENPPKKYQDIYPFHFEGEDWRALWDALRSVFEFWIGQGVRIFRVDNPHTKPFGFWEWAIDDVKRMHPEVLFLSEAFTRPKIMHRLAKLGFSQSYIYFTWRNTKHELVEYFTELAHGPGRHYFRPNAWPNTPDILSEPLQFGGRAMFQARLVLAATLAANYGIYGPAYEHMEAAPREPGSEEYLHSEKYELRHWDLGRADSLAPFIARMNRIRRDNAALQSDGSLAFLPIDNDQLVAYAKRAGENVVVTVVNLDPHNAQTGWLDWDSGEDGPFQMHDLLADERFLWEGRRHFIRLDPARSPAHVMRLRRRLHREQDFDYFG